MAKKNSRPSVSPEETAMIEINRQWKPVFDRYDRHKTGRINLREFRSILEESNNQMSGDIPHHVLDELLNNPSVVKDNVLTYEKFLELIHDDELGTQRPRLHRLIRYAAMAVVPKSQRRSVIRKYLDEYSCMPPPVFVLLVSIIEIGAFIYYCVLHQEISAIGPVPWQSMWIYNPCKRFQVWRFFTYIFIHAGFYHVFFNILVQLLLGIPLEMVHKWWRVSIVYTCGVIAGSLASSISDPHSFLAGASGGVYSLLAAHLASVVINWSEMEFNWVRLLSLMTFIGTDVGVAIYGRYVKEERTRVSYSAHFAGALVGFFIGVNVLRNLETKRWEIIVGWIVLVIYILLMGFAIMFNLLNEQYFINPNDPERCRRDQNIT